MTTATGIGRCGWLATLWLGVVAAALSVGAAAQPAGGARLAITPLGPLAVGAAAALKVELYLPEQAAPPLLLTSDAEGAAVEVVQGRLTRGDAQASDANPLVFRVPLLARSEGQSVVRVRVDAYRCAPGCTPLRVDARAVVEVRRPIP